MKKYFVLISATLLLVWQFVFYPINTVQTFRSISSVNEIIAEQIQFATDHPEVASQMQKNIDDNKQSLADVKRNFILTTIYFVAIQSFLIFIFVSDIKKLRQSNH